MLWPVLSGCNGVRVGYPVKHSNLFYVESNLKQVDNVIYKISLRNTPFVQCHQGRLQLR